MVNNVNPFEMSEFEILFTFHLESIDANTLANRNKRLISISIFEAFTVVGADSYCTKIKVTQIFYWAPVNCVDSDSFMHKYTDAASKKTEKIMLLRNEFIHQLMR